MLCRQQGSNPARTALQATESDDKFHSVELRFRHGVFLVVWRILDIEFGEFERDARSNVRQCDCGFAVVGYGAPRVCKNAGRRHM